MNALHELNLKDGGKIVSQTESSKFPFYFGRLLPHTLTNHLSIQNEKPFSVRNRKVKALNGLDICCPCTDCTVHSAHYTHTLTHSQSHFSTFYGQIHHVFHLYSHIRLTTEHRVNTEVYVGMLRSISLFDFFFLYYLLWLPQHFLD